MKTNIYIGDTLKIFISHSSHDKWVARQLSQALIADGHETFLDEKDIRTGESIDTSIQKHLETSDHLLLLLSPASLKSHWVFIELGGAKALKKHIVPVLFHVAGNEIPQSISQLLARDINEIDKYFAELKKLQSLTETAPEKVAAAEAKSDAAAKRKYRTTAKEMNGFKVGDKVRIAQVEHLTDEEKAINPKWVKSMDKYSGLMTTITAFTRSGAMFLDATGDEYIWNASWVSKVA
jgi:hypothetical protein